MPDTREARRAASEVKCLVDPATGDRIREWARRHLDADPHGAGPFGDEYSTTSLYFDTIDRVVLHRRGSFARAKYRIRRYGALDFVFLERKLRKTSIVVKRRARVPMESLERLDGKGTTMAWVGDWFRRRVEVRGLRPVCVLTYRRMARGLSGDPSFARLTLDDCIRVAPIDRPRFDWSEPGIPILEGRLILELKFRGRLPAVFKRLVDDLALNVQTASKYRFGMTALDGRRAMAEGAATGTDDAHA